MQGKGEAAWGYLGSKLNIYGEFFMIISLKFEKVADTVFDYVITILIWTSSNWIFIVCARVVASGPYL